MKRNTLEKLRIVPLGGLGEVGKNMMSIEYGQDILIVDAGVMFPENDMWGVDLVIPDFGYLMDKKERVRGIMLTHGHEDHIGALPYVVREIPVPVYGTRLTLGLAQVKLREEGLASAVSLNEVDERQPFKIGSFELECFRMNHSVPDGVGLAIRTPRGLIVHSGDFKFDYTPIEGKGADLMRLAQLGGEGVLLLMSDSTNSEEPGFTPSERVVERAFDEVFSSAKGRIIVATFASLISRVQQLVNSADRYERKIAIAGRSMVNNVKMAQELGYLTIPDGMLVDLSAIKNLKPKQVVIAATGSQGEPSSALARMAAGTHKQMQIVPGDTVILSSHAIPGNEEMVSRTINKLFQRGAEVVYEKLAQVHVSGHASQEEQKLLLSLTKPRYFLPIHGELRHLHRHAALARELGMPAENIFVVENGYPIEVDDKGARVMERVPGGYVFVDGASVGDIGPAVLRERESLGRDGFVTAVAVVNRSDWSLARPVQLVTRGMVYLPDAREMLDRAAATAGESLGGANPPKDEADARERVRRALSRCLHDEIGRRPVVDVILIAL
jgi:ribonuclease J